jgi:hypothetical protein
MKTIESHVVMQPDQKGLRFYTDKHQAKKVFDALIERLSLKGPPYHAAHVPQAQQFLPSNMARGSREQAIFFFMLCLWMRGGVESDTASRFLKEMFEKEPEAFIPEKYWGFGPELTKKQVAQVTENLQRYRLGQRVDENAAGWVYNMRKLARFWNSDPRELMKDKPKFKILARRIIGETGKDGAFVNEDNPNGFRFFREKMVAMIAYFLMDAGLVPMFQAPVPVDFHVLRLLVANGVIRAHDKSIEKAVGIDFMKSRVQALAREVTEWYCRKYRISPVALCDSLWLLSRNLCRFNPGNSGYATDDKRKSALKATRNIPDDHPMLDGIDGIEMNGNGNLTASPDEMTGLMGRRRYLGLKWNRNDLLRSTKVRSFKESCGVCPLNGFCRYNISAAAYYTAGKLLPERLRFIPPDKQEGFLGHSAFKSTFHAPVDPTVRFAQIGF